MSLTKRNEEEVRELTREEIDATIRLVWQLDDQIKDLTDELNYLLEIKKNIINQRRSVYEI